MAQTESRAGFRLPWNSERSTDDQSPEAETAAGNGWDDATGSTEAAASSSDAWADSSATSAQASNATPVEEPKPGPARRPSKFLADLTKAMQAAAEEARGLTLSQLQADAKTYVERIHERSATEAANLRRSADDDVAAVREWSKAEIARIREETESRITTRKARLESEIEEHSGLIEREVAAVQARVAAFEQEMADFFERLLGEQDPTRFATMAERLPEPPPFEEMAALDAYEAPVGETAEAAQGTDEVAEAAWSTDEAVAGTSFGEAGPEAVVEADAEAAQGDSDDAETAEAEAATTDGAQTGEAETTPTAEPTDEDAGEAGGFVPTGEVDPDFELDREAAFAAIQAAAEAAASAEVATDAAERAEAVADIAIEIVGSHDDGDADGRSEAAASTDFDAAEAEAAASADAGGDVDEIPVIGDEALAARLAGLLPGKHHEKEGASETRTTQVVVVGLVSVASIASFKRHLGRLNGVQSVGVSSGPEGEFLFAVHHGPDVVVRDLIPSLPSFQARVTGTGEGILNVTAHDPESD